MLKKIALALALGSAPVAAFALAPSAALAGAPAPAAKSAQFTVTGMHCGHCVDRIKSALGKVKGVETVDVQLDKKVVVVTFDDKQTSSAAIQKAIEGVGFKVQPSA